MPPSNTRASQIFQGSLGNLKPSLTFVVMILGALIAFEVFNYSTTDHALRDLLGELTFAGIQWSTILALAFCGIDFAGIARLFTPEQGGDEPKEVWYLFGAWLLAATMNAILTWWGVSMAVANHTIQSSSVIDPMTISSVVPVFVAIMVWIIRILIIGTLALATDRLMHPGIEQRTPLQNAMSSTAARSRAQVQPTQPMSIPAGLNSSAIPARPNLSRAAAASNPRYSRNLTDDQDYNNAPPTRTRSEPTYHSLSMSSRPPVNRGANQNSGTHRVRR